MTTPPQPPSSPDPFQPPQAPPPGQPPAAPPQPGAAQPTFGSPQPGYGQAAYQTPVGYPPAGPYAPSPGAPFGVDPATGIPYSDKSKIVAGILQLVLGSVGAGRWYTGSYGIAVAQLLTCGGLGVWSLIDGILMLVGNGKDPQGRPLHP